MYIIYMYKYHSYIYIQYTYIYIHICITHILHKEYILYNIYFTFITYNIYGDESQVTANVASGAKRASVKLGEVLSPAASWAGTPQGFMGRVATKNLGKSMENCGEMLVRTRFLSGSKLEVRLKSF